MILKLGVVFDFEVDIVTSKNNLQSKGSSSERKDFGKAFKYPESLSNVRPSGAELEQPSVKMTKKTD